MAFAQSVVSVAGAATLLLTGSIKSPTFVIMNSHATATLWLGAANVTADDTAATGGFTLPAGNVLTLAGVTGLGLLYGRTTGATVLVRVLSLGA